MDGWMGVETNHTVLTNIKSRKCHSCGTGFLYCGPINLWGQITLCFGAVLSILGCFSDIPGLYPLEASSSRPVMAPETVNRHSQLSSGATHPQPKPLLLGKNTSSQRDDKVKASDITVSPMSRHLKLHATSKAPRDR